MFKYAFFDLDGTIVMSHNGIFSSVKYALNKMGYEIPSEDVLMKFIGPPLNYSFSNILGFSESDTERAVLLYREHYKDIGVYNNTLYDKVHLEHK